MLSFNSVVFSAATAACAAVLCAGLILLIRPLLQRYALARPNARSSHKLPTPQGGGIAVIAATLAVAYATALLDGGAGAAPPAVLLAGTIVMAGIGVAADIHPIGVAPRFLLQTAAVAAVILSLPVELRVLPILPWWFERALLVVGGVWFVNLVNFMDGLDWITAAEVVPIAAAIAVIGILGLMPLQVVILSLALCGAMIGFAFFNRPVAKLFLGDVGSLPIGLLLGFMLVVLAAHGHRTAAILLPLYYLADSTITLLRRLSKGERIWQAHRSHFYQQATDGGFSVIAVVARIFVLNIVLCALALFTVIVPGGPSDGAALVAGGGLVAWLLWRFAHGRAGLPRCRA